MHSSSPNSAAHHSQVAPVLLLPFIAVPGVTRQGGRCLAAARRLLLLGSGVRRLQVLVLLPALSSPHQAGSGARGSGGLDQGPGPGGVEGAGSDRKARRCSRRQCPRAGQARGLHSCVCDRSAPMARCGIGGGEGAMPEVGVFCNVTHRHPAALLRSARNVSGAVTRGG